MGGRDAETPSLKAYMAHFEDTARQAALQLLLKPQKLSKVPRYSIGFGGEVSFLRVGGLEDIWFNHTGMGKRV